MKYTFKSLDGTTNRSVRFLKSDFSETVIRDFRQSSIIQKASIDNVKFQTIVSARNPYGFSADFFNTPEAYPNIVVYDAPNNDTVRIYGVKGKKGGELGMGLLVGAMDIATANNTVAIVMANPIAKEMAQDYGISPKKAASILDTFSCVFQGIIPYGAQMLVALSVAQGLGHNVSAFQVIPNLIYPFMLLLSSLVFIFFVKEKSEN